MFQQGDAVIVKVWSYAPGQMFWDTPSVCRHHRGTYDYSQVSDGVEVHWINTWTGAGRVGVCSEDIERVHEND